MKDEVIRDLSTIAIYSKDIRPTTIVLPKSRHCAIPKDTVLKRSHSDCGHHVIMPNDTMKRTWEYLSSQTMHGEKWISQEYISTFKAFGEWRVFVVRGHIHHILHTWKTKSGLWDGREVSHYWSLDELWCVICNGSINSIV